MKQYFDDQLMQDYYEKLVKEGMHYRAAIDKTLKVFKDYDGLP